MNGGDGTTTGNTFESGTRIKARTTTTTISSPDGASQEVTSFVGWFDSMRNEPCSPQVAADGKTRCLPIYVGLSATAFADAACTVPAALTIGCNAAVPKYVAQLPPTSCPASTLGPKLMRATAGTAGYYFKSGANCVLTGTPDFTSYAASGSEVMPTEFAEMTVTTTTTP